MQNIIDQNSCIRRTQTCTSTADRKYFSRRSYDHVCIPTIKFWLIMQEKTELFFCRHVYRKIMLKLSHAELIKKHTVKNLGKLIKIYNFSVYCGVCGICQHFKVCNILRFPHSKWIFIFITNFFIILFFLKCSLPECISFRPYKSEFFPGKTGEHFSKLVWSLFKNIFLRMKL